MLVLLFVFFTSLRLALVSFVFSSCFFFVVFRPLFTSIQFLMFRFNVIHRSSHRFLVLALAVVCSLLFSTRLTRIQTNHFFSSVVCDLVYTMKVIGKSFSTFINCHFNFDRILCLKTLTNVFFSSHFNLNNVLYFGTQS